MVTTLLAGAAPDLFPDGTEPTVLQASVVPTITLRSGSWLPQAEMQNALLLVCDGFLSRVCRVGNRSIAELVGPDDVIRPREDADASPFGVDLASWQAHTPARLAVLDRRFLQRMSRCPEILGTIMDRLAARADQIAFLVAVAAQPKAADRLLTTLWALADRWGRVTLDGVVVPVPLTHRALSELVGARRPACTSALARLRTAGLVDRRSDGSWLLHGPPVNAVGDHRTRSHTALMP